MEFQHGGDIYRNAIEYDFSANINPLGMPPKCRQAIENAITHIGEYPDCRGEKLCRSIAEAEGIKEKQFILGNGAAELIYALCNAVRPKLASTVAPTFSEYEYAVTASGGSMEFWNLEEADGFRTDRLIQDWLLQKKLENMDIFFLCNPNNPTGVVMNKEQLLYLADYCKKTNTFLCVDECFLPFLEAEEAYTMKRELENYPQLIVLRAFTKIYGMPGLRLGYAMTANERLLRKMQQCLPPWNTSVIAQAAGIEAIQDTGFVKKTREIIRQEKKYLIKEMQEGLAEKIYDSEANYIFFRSRPDLKKRLLEKKILIRDCSNYRNLTEGYFRIAVRSHEENEELIRRWREI